MTSSEQMPFYTWSNHCLSQHGLLYLNLHISSAVPSIIGYFFLKYNLDVYSLLFFCSIFYKFSSSIIVLICVSSPPFTNRPKPPSIFLQYTFNTFFLSFEENFFIEIIQWKRVVGAQELEQIFCVKVAAFKKNHERRL